MEEPLEIRVQGLPLAVTMRTPGDDEDLAAGFLYSEGVIDDASRIASIEVLAPQTGDLVDLGRGASEGPERTPNRVAVTLHGELDKSRFNKASREFRATAACGVCGKQKLEDLCQDLMEITQLDCDPKMLLQLPDRMRPHQRLFDATGGIHAAGLFDPSGKLLCVREDIGRHNAVDKIIGHFLRQGELPLSESILVVSGRAGFELVQKALRAGVPVMVAVGAASSLAVDMATHSGMALYSFVSAARGNLHL